MPSQLRRTAFILFIRGSTGTKGGTQPSSGNVATTWKPVDGRGVPLLVPAKRIFGRRQSVVLPRQSAAACFVFQPIRTRTWNVEWLDQVVTAETLEGYPNDVDSDC
jgi:hypothetical protein